MIEYDPLFYWLHPCAIYTEIPERRATGKKKCIPRRAVGVYPALYTLITPLLRRQQLGRHQRSRCCYVRSTPESVFVGPSI